MMRRLLTALFFCTVTLSAQTVESGYRDIPEITAPGNPAANTARWYAKDDTGTTKLCYKDSAGTETCVGAGGTPDVTVVDKAISDTSATCDGTFQTAATATVAGGTFVAGDRVVVESYWRTSGANAIKTAQTQLNGVDIAADNNIGTADPAYVVTNTTGYVVSQTNHYWFGYEIPNADITIGNSGINSTANFANSQDFTFDISCSAADSAWLIGYAILRYR